MCKIITKENIQTILKPGIRKQFIDKNGSIIEIFGFYKEEKLVLQGFYEFKVIKGLVSIMSSTFDSSNTSNWYRIFSPLTHSIPIILSISSNKNTTEGDYSIYSKEITSFIQTLDKFVESIIFVRSFNCNLKKIEIFFPFTKDIWGTKEKNMKNTYNIVDNYTNFPLLNIPKSWSSTIDIIYSSNFNKETVRVIVCGPKSSGKSTFGKNLINKFLTQKYNTHKTIKKINYVETDPNQPEFSPHGLICSHFIENPIINPPFTHCTLPSLLKAHFLGNTSPQNNPKYFLLCINDIINACERNIPTIINTPGWTKGIGLELLSEIINLSNCTHIIYIGSETNFEAFDIKLTLPSSVKLYTLPSVQDFFNTCETFKINTSDLRILSIISYFHSKNTSGSNYIEWKFNSSLLNMKPWVVKYDGSLTGIDAISILDATIEPDNFYYAINGTIMALIAIDVKENKNIWESLIIKSKDFLPTLNLEKNPIDPKHSQCLGLCILRGISRESKELQILTPINILILNEYLNSKKKLILVRGSIELPTPLMLNYKEDNIAEVDWIKTPYLSMENGGIGSKTWHPRRNIERTTMRMQN
ncbi:polynucleotide 5'-hydroxyl-kinase [Pneumocystis jirovecii RU7]|uniref:Polynucleotide 5'-hydroxyl-kinase GRC3 n=1 Tax=Pneumocystis jirovecii (strain RU7) TaxID=1408657 RepID=A0A0W4ZHU6_PNEJ7|nr:polynucleotide 5'-hydroxyl-kinase [Pneumocystis jirovecii RU7]KTW27949.1 hypothetical protein T551_02916 [Pneumocystis jirovecii RU7]